MKFSSILLILTACASNSNAFVVQGPKGSGTALHSTPPFPTRGNGDSRDFSKSGDRKGPPQKTLIRADGSSGGPASMPGAGLKDSARPASPAEIAEMQRIKNIWETNDEITVQGGSLRTWSVTSPYVERVAVALKTDGRPLNANVELWHGPDNTPQKMAVYLEDGSIRPFSAVIETPRGHNAIAIRNTGYLEFPLSAVVEADAETDGRTQTGLGSIVKRALDLKKKIVQGGAVQTYPFEPNVESVQVMLKTDGRPLNARIELLQGPNNNKQVVEIYTEDGMERPFYMVIETPGVGNVVRIVNTAPVEFPLLCSVEPFLVGGGRGAGGWNADADNRFGR